METLTYNEFVKLLVVKHRNTQILVVSVSVWVQINCRTIEVRWLGSIQELLGGYGIIVKLYSRTAICSSADGHAEICNIQAAPGNTIAILGNAATNFLRLIEWNTVLSSGTSRRVRVCSGRICIHINCRRGGSD
jgi:hypothetical protein